MIRRSLLVGLFVASAGVANAQVVVRSNAGTGGYSTFGAVTVGLTQPFNVRDAKSGSEWDFQGGDSFGLTLDRYVWNGVSLGIMYQNLATQAQYIPAPGSAAPFDCTPRCIANSTQNTIMAYGHWGDGIDLHFVVEGGAGINILDGFTSQGVKNLAPKGTEMYVAYLAGAGLGYQVNKRVGVEIVEDAQGLVPTQTGTNRGNDPLAFQTRVGFRVSLF